ncbi:Uncharacterised protein (plasmid) [Tsukamurella tyrosinosolvens]|uniref:Uncharacterized protein n=1 Tax=Tsukamurella tyrosinosolvens TaxID=57704 RepID=A0A1H4QR86_TSUTY|nr:hypothetical protein [Tsukamurella tyrosinosolvens]KXO91505.1 hypothetical protein AXK58_20115 [Tsukamurella tyrosinosolvens]SEC22014.1 hypothetical protein SAMN04489793_1821 [Tsukamurella tyrosinosolvens]VEH92500.1 Uncharacterised protein [Tsukamurella tyrosinosolvens]
MHLPEIATEGVIFSESPCGGTLEVARVHDDDGERIALFMSEGRGDDANHSTIELTRDQAVQLIEMVLAAV